MPEMRPYDPETQPTYVDFGGFYYSTHADLLDEMETSEFCYAYMADHPEDVEFLEAFDRGNILNLNSDPLPTDAANDYYERYWNYDRRRAADAYAAELVAHVNAVFNLHLVFDRISWTRDNFQGPDLIVLRPLQQDNVENLELWLNDEPERPALLDERITHATTPTSGFAPFYTYEQMMSDAGWRARLTLEMMFAYVISDDACPSENWLEQFRCNQPVQGEFAV
jgi:hypothetical protein